MDMNIEQFYQNSDFEFDFLLIFEGRGWMDGTSQPYLRTNQLCDEG